MDPRVTVTDLTDRDGCPGCGGTDGVQPNPAPPKVKAWMCTACGMRWAITVVTLPSQLPLRPALDDIGSVLVGNDRPV